MKRRQRQPHVPEVPVARFVRLGAGVAQHALARDAHAAVERAVGARRAVAVEVEEAAVADLEDALVDDVLLGTAVGGGTRLSEARCV